MSTPTVHRGKRLLVAAALATMAGTAAVAATPAYAGTGPNCTVTAPTGTVKGDSVSLTATTTAAAQRVAYYLDDTAIGYGFGTDGTHFHYVAYGTANQAWASTAVSNGTHQLSCRAWSAAGTGALGAPTPVTTSNPVTAQITAPGDGATVAGTVTVTATFTGSGTLPSEATLTLDNSTLTTMPCTVSGTTSTCTADWDTVATTSSHSWDTAMGLRVLGVSAMIGTTSVTAQPVRTFVNQYSDSTLELSAYERAGLGRVGRDGGWSATLPGDPTRDMVTFGDGLYLPVTGPLQGQVQGAWGNSNATATHANGVFDSLIEQPNPGDPAAPPQPTPILGSSALKAPDGSACPAADRRSWTTGIVAKPNSSHLLISYWSFCNADGQMHTQVFGIADWDPETNTATSHDVFVQTPDLLSQDQLSSPNLDGGYLYWIRSVDGATYLARVPATPTDGDQEPWTDSAQYQWRTARGWSSDPTQAVDQLPAAVPGGATQSLVQATNLDGAPWLLIVRPNWNAPVTVSVFTSSSPAGPWSPVTDWQNKVVCASCTGLLYAIYGHPERSTTSTFVVTFSDPETGRNFQQSWPVPSQLA